MCVPLERERLRERERKERERERVGGGERERERKRDREEEKRREEKTPQEDVPSFRTKLLFHFFFRAKTNPFPANRVRVRQSALGLTYMRNGDYHGAITEADLALRIACALSPPFFYGCLRTVRFQRPLALSTQPNPHLQK